MINAFYTRVGKYYDEEAEEFEARYWKNPLLHRMRQSFREEVKRYRYKTMLEVGCGTGLDVVHFAVTHPQAEIYGIDVSEKMVGAAEQKISSNQLTNAHVFNIDLEESQSIFQDIRFDMIYVFFGALNTVEDLAQATAILGRLLAPGGTMVLSFVNKFYLGGVLIDSARFRFGRAFARFRHIWGGYSPVRNLYSRCYTPSEIRRVFSAFRMVRHHGYCIVHPAWYFTVINKRLGRARWYLWRFDEWLNRSFLWRFGEYTLFTFQKIDGSDKH